jgi:probable rRNA maturation factor
MVVNRQAAVSLSLRRIRAYCRRLDRALSLDGRDFNVCLVADREIARLNARYRNKRRPTDVLSFRWAGEDSTSWREAGALADPAHREFTGFLGDIVISTETARRNARLAGHSTAREIRWLILHGCLHLLGFDHATDHGEMTRLELELRARLGV